MTWSWIEQEPSPTSIHLHKLSTLHHEVWNLKEALGDLRRYYNLKEWFHPQNGEGESHNPADKNSQSSAMTRSQIEQEPSPTSIHMRKLTQVDGRHVGVPCITKSKVYRNSWVVNVIPRHREVKGWIHLNSGSPRVERAPMVRRLTSCIGSVDACATSSLIDTILSLVWSERLVGGLGLLVVR